MPIVLFAGPSIHAIRDQIPAEFDLRPPARCGDVLRAVTDGASHIGLIDGFFGEVPSVWHKEILLALARGVVVLGAASMGALRAAECSAFGMQGVGRIYRDYLEGRRVADCDVAVLHGPAEMGFVPLTIALVEAEAALDDLASSALISTGEARVLRVAAHDLSFRRRTWPAVLAAAGIAGSRQAAIRNAVATGGLGPKTSDALELIRRLPHARPAATRVEAPVTRFTLKLETDLHQGLNRQTPA